MSLLMAMTAPGVAVLVLVVIGGSCTRCCHTRWRWHWRGWCLQLQLQLLSPAWSSLVLALAFSPCLQLQLQPLLPALSSSVLAAAAAAVVAIGVVLSAAAVVGVGDVAA